MMDERARNVARLLTGAVAAVTVCWGSAGVAQADEVTSGSHNGPRFGLVNIHIGQVDDPAEDVLEHFRLIGDEQFTETAAG
ncbi:hypothetical protein ACIQNG_27090 [Streptomyces sp. NPDC091377]|uniref:hypothetical protein n=1 Tax=unclassified Streptomyces TaxID=2593676 RepID=UPI00381213C1